MFTAILFTLLALAPGVYARWSSRELLRKLDDPLLPDEILAHSRRVGFSIGLSIVPGVFLFPGHLPAFLFLLWISLLAFGFRARKAIFTESWSFPAYLDHMLRFWAGYAGIFALIALIPSVMVAAGERALGSGLLLGAAACLWSFRGTRIFRALMRARPLEKGRADALEPLLSPLIAKAKCPRPDLYVADARGGSWVNAFALPAIRRPGVLFTEGLLSSLTPAETAAIFAHELAHLEHFTRKKLLVARSAVVLVVAIVIFLWAGPSADLLRGFPWVLPVLFLVVGPFRARRNQSHESESDRRAIELGCDPEALVSGLEKLHALLRVSRRWDAAFEKLSTHPSLARRIRAIRMAAGRKEEVSLSGLERMFRSADESGRAVRFDDTCLHWLRGLPADDGEILAQAEERRTYRYADLSELRLEMRAGTRELVLRRRDESTTIRMPVEAKDASAIEAILDRVDSLLGEPASPEPTPKGRPVSLMALVLGLTISLPSISWIVALLAGLALARPAEATLLALGAGALATAVFRALALDPWWKPLAFAAVGTLALVIAAIRSRRGIREKSLDERLATLVPLALVLLTSVGAAAAYVSSLPAMIVHLWASETTAVFAGLTALGAVLARARGVVHRIGAAFVFLLAIGYLYLGSSSFRERFGNDLFASPGPPLPVEERPLTRLREVVVPGGVSELMLSPSGSRFAVSVAPASEKEYHASFDREFLLETADGSLRSVTAIAIAYIDDEKILVLEKTPGRAALKVATLGGAGSFALLHELPLLAGSMLDCDASGNWQVRGTDWENSDHVVVRGTLGPEPPLEMRLSSHDGLSTLIAVNRDGFALLERYEFDESFPYLMAFTWGQPWVTALDLKPRDGTEVGLGRSALQAHCFSIPLDEARFFCSSSDRGRMGLFSIDPRSRSVRALGHVPYAGYGQEVLPGALLPLFLWNQPALLVDLERGVALSPVGADLHEAVLAFDGNILAVARLAEDGDETTVSLYTVGE